MLVTSIDGAADVTADMTADVTADVARPVSLDLNDAQFAASTASR